MKINFGKIFRTLSLSAALMTGTTMTVSGQGLTIVTHGWDWPTDPNGGYMLWTNTMANSIYTATPSWSAKAYHWSFSWTLSTSPYDPSPISGNKGSNTWTPSEALDNGRALGKYMADQVNLNQYNAIHLIGHSAGTGLIAAYAQELRARGYDGIIQLTSLDAYTPDAASITNLTQAKTGGNLIEHYHADDVSSLISNTDEDIPGAQNYKCHQ
ncbi:MAG: hypothetical protein LBD30_04620 [Verrucomicrobiales bacterium]|jgi:hypothetical protein|nr:hypothetical protein [Verrucomicrobiales bacterium]